MNLDNVWKKDNEAKEGAIVLMERLGHKEPRTEDYSEAIDYLADLEKYRIKFMHFYYGLLDGSLRV